MARKKFFISVALLSMSLSGVALSNENQKTQRFETDVSQAQEISIDLPAGQVLVVGATGTKVLAEVKASCKQDKKTDLDSCRKLLNELDWSKTIGKNTELGLVPSKITRYEDIQVEIKMSVPKDKKLNVNLAAGDLSIEGTSACVNANLNAGQLNLKVKESDLASVNLKAKVGDVKLTNTKDQTQAGERFMLVGANLGWNKGAGSCSLTAEVLAGEVHLTLY